MVSGMIKKHLQRRKNNKGAALVMVIVSIAFIGMLVAMILYMSYANYIMKGTDKRTKDNFYSAEYALDVINAGIQTDISAEMSKAYVYVMQNSQGMSDSDMSVNFRQRFMSNMLAKVQQSSTETGTWKYEYLRDKWKENPNDTDPNAPTIFEIRSAGAPPQTKDGAVCLEPADPADRKLVTDNASYFELRGVKITFTDKNGYVSVIRTDIRVDVPNLDFAMSSSKLSVENFSLIANDELLNISDKRDYMSGKDISLEPDPADGIALGSGNVEVTGSVFGGYTGITMDNQKKLTFKNDSNDDATYTYLLAAKAVNVRNCRSGGAGIFVENRFRTYVEDIDVRTSDLDLDGETYVADDMEISGSGSKVTLHGIYKGYGNEKTGAKGSSSILINGASTTLDFSDLNTLTLAGRAYVGATKYDPDSQRQAEASSTEADLTTDKTDPSYDASKANKYDESSAAEVTAGTKTVYPQNKANVMMGQSIAVKADQLLYMVPDECVGYDRETGAQYVAKNPMTYDEYYTLTTAKSDTLTEKNVDGTDKRDAQGNVIYQNKYDVVRLTNLWSSLDNMEYTTKDADGRDKYKAIFRRISGTVMVYLYLDFGTDENRANEFYKAYYDTQPDVINNYVNSYVKDVKFGSQLAGSGSGLSLAGNAFYMNGNNVVFEDDTTEDPNKTNRVYEEADLIADQHTAAMHSLQTIYSLMLPEQENKEIFDFLVPDSARSVLASLRGQTLHDRSGAYAIVSDRDVNFTVSTSHASEVHLIITSGDVYLNRDIEGLVIAGGRIFIGSGCRKITYNPALVVQAMKAYDNDDPDNRTYAYEALGINGILTYGVATGGSDDKISIRDLITYQNWKKE